MPIRVQRKRVKGWKLPENTKCVDRSSKWGNPFKLMGDIIYIDAGHRRKILDKWVIFSEGGNTIEDVLIHYELLVSKQIVSEDNPDLQYWIDHFNKLDLRELEGKNLCCFCNLDSSCHADSLLSMANNKDIVYNIFKG